MRLYKMNNSNHHIIELVQMSYRVRFCEQEKDFDNWNTGCIQQVFDRDQRINYSSIADNFSHEQKCFL